MFTSNIIPIKDVMVRPEVVETHFSCDLEKCKGACCTLESEYGAPLREEEVTKIEEILHEVLPYLPEAHKKEIAENGFYDVKDGELMASSVNNKACVFVYFDGDIAKCGIEKAFFDGKVDFRKPISCHLFPIRVSRFGGDVLRYEKFSECKPALKKGADDDVKIADFCEDSLVRLYGRKWYEQLKETTGK